MKKRLLLETEHLGAIKALESIAKECNNSDEEAGHSNADEILCGLLSVMGYKDIVEAYRGVDKYYA